jgi:hypothetical protein
VPALAGHDQSELVLVDLRCPAMFAEESFPVRARREGGRSVPSWTLSLSITFALTCASATFFLFQRCHGAGRPFGRGSRVWALLVIGVTSLLSTGVAVAGAMFAAHLPMAFLGLGVVGPSGLWLSQIHDRRAERHGLVQDVWTLWLSRLLARLQEGMAEERNAWCEQRLDQAWSTSELSMAARHYRDYLRDRMSPEERRRSRIYALPKAIETRLAVVQLIDDGSGRPEVSDALQASHVTKGARYSNHLGDLGRMADILRHDAERDLVRLLGFAYSGGYYRMPAFSPPLRVTAVMNVSARPTRARAQPQVHRP